MKRQHWTLALGVVFLAGHLPYLAPALEDVDSQNFALALRDFNPALHQPHPPGYPIFVALGKLALVLGLTEAHALAVWGPIFGILAIPAIVQLYRAVEGVGVAESSASVRPLLATLLAVVCPLFWFTAVRPMSDMPGLAMALAAQALLVVASLPGVSAVLVGARKRAYVDDLTAVLQQRPLPDAVRALDAVRVPR